MRHTRVGLGLTTALAVSLAPLATGPLSFSVLDTAAHTAPLQAGGEQDQQARGRADGFAPYPAPQRIAPRTVIEGRILPGDHRKVRIDGPRGGHVWTASALLDHDLPAAALTAYKNAAVAENRVDPACQIPWTLLAGIGRVESNHGRYGGSVLSSDGISRPAILGVPLNGVGPVAAIRDTDNGRYDGDKVWDRAVGPMQFIPSTWAYAGRDGDGDGLKSPNDLNDAALAAAGYLCSGPGSVLPDAAMRAAIFRYNPSDYYVSLVMAFARGYQTGVFTIPSPPAPGQAAQQTKQDAKEAKAHAKRAKALAKKKAAKVKAAKVKAAKLKAAKTTTKAGAAAKAGSKTSTKPSPTATKAPARTTKPSPSPKPSPSGSGSGSPSSTDSPSPSGTPPQLGTVTGTLAGSGTSWTLDGQAIDLGTPPTTTGQDYDGDGQAESLAAELAGLAGESVTLGVEQGTLVVYEIAGKPFRKADGTYVS